MMTDIKALYGYPYWEDCNYAYIMLPYDGIIVRFKADMKKNLIYSVLEQNNMIKRFDFHTNMFPLKDGIVLYVTSRCNCSCDYCEASIGSSAQDMSRDTINAAFEFSVWIARRYKRRRFSVTLLGGEPTVNTDAIIGLIERFNLAGTDIILSLCTNGMIAERDLSRLIKYDNIEWKISLDVPDEKYSYSDCRSGTDYAQIFNTIDKVTSYQKKHIIRTTVTNKNLFLMDELAHRCELLGIKKIVYTPMRVAYGKSLDMANVSVDVETYTAKWYECRRKCENITITDTHFDMMFGYKTPYCSSTFIMPDGTILPAIAEAYSQKQLHIGNVTERDWIGFETKLNILKKQFHSDVEENCRDCIGRHICAGGSMATELYLGTHRQAKECLYLRQMITEACKKINALLPHYGDIVNHDSIPDYIQLIDYSKLKNKI